MSRRFMPKLKCFSCDQPYDPENVYFTKEPTPRSIVIKPWCRSCYLVWYAVSR